MDKQAHTVDHHIAGRQPHVRVIYDRLVAVARQFGPVHEQPKKTSIHLANRTAFAGVATRKDAIILTLKFASDIAHPRIIKHEQVSANRWHLDVRLESADQVDAELTSWLLAAYGLAV